MYRKGRGLHSVVMDQIAMANSPSPHCDHGMLPFLYGRGVEDESAPPLPNGTEQNMALLLRGECGGGCVTSTPPDRERQEHGHGSQGHGQLPILFTGELGWRMSHQRFTLLRKSKAWAWSTRSWPTLLPLTCKCVKGKSPPLHPTGTEQSMVIDKKSMATTPPP